MKVVLKNGASKAELKQIEDIFRKGKSAAGFNAKKYNGIIPLKGDAFTVHQKLRAEWERDIR